MCSNGKTHKQENGMDYNVSEYAVICFLILTASINISSWSDNIFTTATMHVQDLDCRYITDVYCTN